MTTQYAAASKKYRDDLKVAGIATHIVEATDADWARFGTVPGSNNRSRFVALLDNYFKRDVK